MSTSLNESFFIDGAQVVWKKGVPEKYEIAKTDGILQTKEGPQKYKSGYYILTGPEGEQYSMPSATFSKLKDDNGDSTATPKKIPKLAKIAEADGNVQTAWGEELEYRAGKDYIVRHDKGDYGVVKAEIFDKTYERGGSDFEKNTHRNTGPLGVKPLVRTAGSFNRARGVDQPRAI